MDIAGVLASYMTQATGFPWYHDRPAGASGRLGTVTRDGGPTEMVRDMPTVTMLVYGDGRADAAQAAQVAKRAFLEAPHHVENVFTAEIMGDYYDPLDGMCRHRITATLVAND